MTPRRPGLLAVAAGLGWAALLAAVLLRQQPAAPFPLFPQGHDGFSAFRAIGALGRHAAAAVAVAGWLAGLAGWGLAAGGFLRLGPGWGSLLTHARLGAGFVLCGTAVLGLGLAGLLQPWPLAACLLGPGIVALAAGGPPRRRARPIPWHAIALVPPVLVALPGMLAPEGSWDAMVYHLRLPSFYLLEHKLFLLGESPFAGYPPLADLHFLLALGLTGADAVPKLQHAACWLLTAAALRASLPAAPAAGTLLAAAWLLSPLGLHLAGMAYVDHAVAWMAVLAFASLGGRVPRGPNRLVLAGFFAGGAAAVKYTGALAAGGVAAWAAGCCARGRIAPPRVALALAASAAVAGAWGLRNLLELGNPVYPFASGVLGGLPSATLEFWTGEGARAGAGARGLLRPLAAAFSDAGGVGAVLGPSWIAVAGIAVAARRLDGRWVPAAAMVLAWWATPLDARFLLPAIPVVLLASAPALVSPRPALAGRLALAVLAPAVLWIGARASVVQYDPLPPVLGLRSVEAHLRGGLAPSPEYYAVTGEINRRLPARARLLMLGGIKSYYIDRRTGTPHQHIDPVPLVRELRRAGDAVRLSVRLRQRGFTHLLYLPRAAAPSAAAAGMSRPEARTFVGWLRRCTRFAFRAGEGLVYEVGPPREPRALGRVPLLEELALREATGDGPAGAAARLAEAAEESSSAMMIAGVRELLRPAGSAARVRWILEAATAHPEASSIAWRAYGFTLSRMGEATAALEAYRRATSLNPSDAEAHLGSARLLLGAGRRSDACASLRAALRLEPGRRDLLDLYDRACRVP